MSKPRLTIPPDVHFQQVAGEVVLLNAATGAYFGLNLVGARIWDLLARHGDLELVVQGIVAEYEVDEAQARADVLELVTELTNKGLLAAS